MAKSATPKKSLVEKIKWEGLSQNQLDKILNYSQKEHGRRSTIQSLSEHDGIKKVNATIRQVAEETGVSEVDIRLAEIKKFIIDIPGFADKVWSIAEAWKREHATHRNPQNPDEYWYSPNEGGNPPKWLKERLGTKPDKKNTKALDAWTKKLEAFRVKPVSSKKAA